MKRAGLLLLLAGLVLGIGCASSETEPAREAVETIQTDDLVTRAAEIAKAVEADPDSAEEILASHDVTVEQFEQMMYDISADPELTKAYEAALGD